MKLICHPVSGITPRIVPAPTERRWMDDTPNGFAYRCLPMNIANAHAAIRTYEFYVGPSPRGSVFLLAFRY